jgi:hypothetical protein
VATLKIDSQVYRAHIFMRAVVPVDSRVHVTGDSSRFDEEHLSRDVQRKRFGNKLLRAGTPTRYQTQKVAPGLAEKSKSSTDPDTVCIW